MKFVILSALLLTGCAQGEPLPKIQGRWQPLNPTYWTPNAQDQAAIEALPE
jgi:hypothetical protein